jgi:clathrin heavy chain
MTFESQKYVCIKEGQQVAIVDTSQNFKVDRKDMKAEGILMHREQNIIAVRASTGENAVIQVYDVAASKKIKNVEIKEKCVFWRWISTSKIAVVGTTSVYHIDTTNEASQPVKIFERIPQMSKCQIMSYDVDASETWCYLVGLYSDEARNINSQIQLYNVEKKQTMPLEGYAACFTEMPVTEGNNSFKNGLFCFCEKKAAE